MCSSHYYTYIYNTSNRSNLYSVYTAVYSSDRGTIPVTYYPILHYYPKKLLLYSIITQRRYSIITAVVSYVGGICSTNIPA